MPDPINAESDQQQAERHARGVRAALRRIRRHARTALIVRGAAQVLAGLIWVLIVLGLADALLRLPEAMRWLALVGLAAAIVTGFVVLILPAIRFAPSLADLAIRLERGLPKDQRGLLSSAVDLDRSADGSDLTSQLSRRVVTDGVNAFEAARRARVIRYEPAGVAIGYAMLAGLVVLIAGIIAPAGVGIAAQRLLTPWTNAAWPNRTALADATRPEPHASDLALPLRAVVVRAPGGAESADVVVRHRVVTDGRVGPWRRAALAGQRRNVEANSGQEGALFERLLEPASFGEADSGERTLEFKFESGDDETEITRVTIVDPPRLLAATASVQPPVYAGPLVERNGYAHGAAIDLGDGADERSVASRVLAGSSVALEMTFSKPVVGSIDAPPAWLTPMLDEPGSQLTWTERDGRSVVRIESVLQRSVRLSIDAEDAFGLPIREEPTLSFDVIPDGAPTVTVTEPARDEAVLATAIVALQAEARDDLGLASLDLRRRIAKPQAGSITSEADSANEPTVIASWTEAVTDEALLETMLDLSALGVKAGDEVWIDAAATDVLASSLPSEDPRAEPVISSVRRLRIIAESELIERMRAQLAGVRRAAMRLDERQGEVIEAGDPSPASAGETQAGDEDSPTPRERSSAERRRAEQVSLTERIASQLEAVERLNERQQRNGLSDEALEGLLQEASDLLRDAAQSSGEASGKLAKQAAEEAAEEAAGESGEAGQADEAEEEFDEEADPRPNQDAVRDRLGEVVRMLDRGEDGWLARRGIERLIQDQQRLAEDTARIARDTVGQSLDELSEDDRTTLERIADRQRELSQRAEEALDDLSERGDALEKSDAAQAQAMREAARSGRSNGLSQQLEQAAEQIGQNQTGAAQEAQQEAMDALEGMLEQLENADQRRDEALKRTLANLTERVQRLIELQEEAIVRVTDNIAGNEDGSDLDKGMIRIHEGTLVCVDLAGGAPELLPAKEALERAASKQTEAITILRAELPELDRAEQAERESLRELERSLEEAERQQEQAEQRERDRQLRELRQAYREALEEQVALRGETEPVVGKRLTRRERAEVRGIGQRQASLRQRVAELPEAYEELGDVRSFTLIHDRLDASMAGAEADLGRGAPSDGTLALQDGSIDLLSSIVEALGPNNQQNDEFQNAGGGGGGGQSGQSGLIQIAQELKIVRSMQREVSSLTRVAEESGEDRAGGLDAIGLSEYQSTIAETLSELLERLQEQNQPLQMPGPGGGDGP